MRRATAELADHRRTPATIADLAYHWDRWLEWCAVNTVRPLPTDQRTVRRYLHSQTAHWAVAAKRRAADAIAEAHVTLGFDDPSDGIVRTYLAASRRAGGGRPDERPMDPVLLSDALAICAADTSPPPYRRLAAATTIALCFGHHHQMTPAQLAGAQVTVDGRTVRLRTADGSRWHLDGHDCPEALDAGTYLVERGATALDSADAIKRALDRTSARAGTAIRTHPHLAAGVDDDELGWILWWTDPGFLRQLRDKTLLVVGVALARRGIELGEFDATDFTPSPADGYDVRIRFSKTDREGRGIDHFLPHLPPDQEHPWCPACALGAWLYVLERRYGAPWTGPLFPARVDGRTVPSGRMGTHLVRLAVDRLWERARRDPNARIGSRSMRIGGATSAYASGMDIAEIAEQTTKHRSLDACERYIRADDEFHLPV